MSNCQKGSEWSRWDLHVHSPASDGFVGTWEQFEEQLRNADCEVVGINDYFSVEGYKKIKNRIDSGELNLGVKTIFPVVEFRMRDVLQNRHTGKTGVNINFHVVFDNTIPVTKIETFIKSLKVEDSQIADRYSDQKFLKESAKVYFKKDVIDELRNNPDFHEKFLVFLPYDEYGGIGDIDPDTDDWIKKGFIRDADIIGSSNKNQIDFFLWKSQKDKEGNDKFSYEQFEKWFLCKKPCIKGSDSHKHNYPIGRLKDNDSNPIEKYCWIKAEPTFEGLKQIKYDPESRVCVSVKKPVSPTNIIKSIVFDIPKVAKISVKQKEGSTKEEKFCFAGVKDKFCLSSFFNCFIGGRGSGKSTILNFLGQYSNESDSSEIFWDKIQPTFDTKDKNLFSFDGIEVFEFIGQSEVEGFATNKEMFTAAIYERANILSEGALEKDELKLVAFLKRINLFQDLIEDIRDLETQRADKEKEKKILENSIEITKSKEYVDIIKEITKKSNKKQILESWKNIIDELRDSITELQQQFVQEPEVVIEEDLEIPVVEGEQEDDIAKIYSEAYKKVQTNITSAIKVLKESNFKDLVKKENELGEDIEKYEKELSQLLRNAGLSEENILQVKSAPQKLVKIGDELFKLEKRINEKKKELEDYDKTIENTLSAKTEFEKVISESIMPLSNILNEQVTESNNENIKNIGLSYFFDIQQAWQKIGESFYNYFVNRYKGGERGDLVKSYIVTNKEVFSKEESDIRELLKGEEKQTGYIKFLRDVFSVDSNYRIFRTLRDSHLNNVSEYKRIQVLYDGKDIEHASFGQKCTAVIVVLLLFGNYPLIIDEPEAHLDSSLIANYLVPLIKRKKINRQIIFATHNANFVINGDAEKIFILRNETGITKITETTIEDLANREQLLKLEGGRAAFKKRGEKLHIKE